MRAAFLVTLLLLSVFYAALAFVNFNFLSPTGRIAPGFFPQIISTLLVGMTLYCTAIEFRRKDADEPVSEDWRVVLGVLSMVFFLILACHWLGALPAMVLFMLLSLSVLNRGRHLTNVLVGVLLPVGIYTLFRYSLNAAMPPGMLGLPL